MAQKFDIRQSASYQPLDQIAPTATVTTGVSSDDVMASINSEATMPLRMRASTPVQLVLNIDNAFITNPQSGRNRRAPSIGGVLFTFSGGTITLSATGAGNATPNVGSPISLGMSATNWMKVAVHINSAGSIVLTKGTPGGSLITSGDPPVSGGCILLGYFVVRTDPSNNVYNITGSDIYQYGFAGLDTTGLTNPMVAAGDMIYGGASGVPTDLATGVTAGVLHGGNGATPSWSQIVNTDISVSAAIDGNKIVAASNSVTGVITTTTQNFAGPKIFEGGIGEITYVGANPEVGGSTPFQLTAAHHRKQILSPAGAITVRLPTTGILTGDTWTISNTTNNIITIQSSDTTALVALGQGTVSFVSLQNTPTGAAHWKNMNLLPVVGRTDGVAVPAGMPGQVIETFGTATASSTNLANAGLSLGAFGQLVPVILYKTTGVGDVMSITLPTGIWRLEGKTLWYDPAGTSQLFLSIQTGLAPQSPGAGQSLATDKLTVPAGAYMSFNNSVTVYPTVSTLYYMSLFFVGAVNAAAAVNIAFRGTRIA